METPQQQGQEFTMGTKTVDFVARLGIGTEAPDKVHTHLETDGQIETFGGKLGRSISPLTIVNTADCMDGRGTIRMGDGTDNPAVLRKRVVSQLPGGLVLATTKAAVAANAAFLRDAQNMQQAYETTFNFLTALGYEDGGHAGCGASKFVEKSVADAVSTHVLIPTVGAVIGMNEARSSVVTRNTENMRRRLETGFFGNWSNGWHEDFLSQRVPHNNNSIPEDIAAMVAKAPDYDHEHRLLEMDEAALVRQGLIAVHRLAPDISIRDAFLQGMTYAYWAAKEARSRTQQDEATARLEALFAIETTGSEAA